MTEFDHLHREFELGLQRDILLGALVFILIALGLPVTRRSPQAVSEHPTVRVRFTRPEGITGAIYHADTQERAREFAGHYLKAIGWGSAVIVGVDTDWRPVDAE